MSNIFVDSPFLLFVLIFAFHFRFFHLLHPPHPRDSGYVDVREPKRKVRKETIPNTKNTSRMADYLLFEDLSSSSSGATNNSNLPSSYVQAAPSSSVTMITYPIFTFYLVGVVTLIWILIQRIYSKYRIREMELVQDRKLTNKSLELHDSSNEGNDKGPRTIRRRKVRAGKKKGAFLASGFSSCLF
jgi:hypothetical protein